MKKLSSLLAKTAKNLQAVEHPRVSVAWQDTDLVYRKVYNPSADIGFEIIGKRLEDVIDDAAAAKRLSDIKRTVIRTTQAHHETVTVAFDGKQHHYDLTIEPTYDEAGKLDGLISVNIEVTDLVEAKKHLAEANERLVQMLAETLERGTPVGKYGRD